MHQVQVIGDSKDLVRLWQGAYLVGMAKDVDHCRECITCQQTKPHLSRKETLSPWQQLASSFHPSGPQTPTYMPCPSWGPVSHMQEFYTKDYVWVSGSPFDARVCIWSPGPHPHHPCRPLLRPTEGQPHQEDCSLFCFEELGDRKPSQLLRCLQHLFGDSQGHISPPFLWELFLQQQTHGPGLHFRPSSLEDLAQLADHIMDVSPPTVAAVTPTPLPELDHLRTGVARLQSLVQQPKTWATPAVSHPVLQLLPYLQPLPTSQPLLVPLSVWW